jgi:glycosyltransferase involved in cell wall biosynthesis
MLLALAEALPAGVVMLCVDRPVTIDVTPWRNPRRFFRHIWRSTCVAESSKLRIATVRTLLHDNILRHVPWLSHINAAIVGMQLRKMIRKFAPDDPRIVQWIYHPMQAWTRLAFPGAAFIYECYDEHWHTPDGEPLPKMRALETEILGIADVTFVTTSTLLEKRRELTKTIHLLPNGIPDFFLDEPAPVADLIDKIPHPRIGYVGVIRRPMNLMLLRDVFAQHPDWQLVLVGPVQRHVGIELVAKLPNVHIVGARPFDSLPAIMRKLDVGLIPHEINEFTRVMSPLKLMEYLSAGLPIVATRLTELAGAGQFIVFAEDNVASFSAAVETAVGRAGPSYRRRAREHAEKSSWRMIATRDVLPVIQGLFDHSS